MFKITVFLAVVCLAAYAHAIDESDAVVTKYRSEVNEDGSYSYEYGTSNNIEAQETGVGSAYASGSYSYIAPDGQPIRLEYTADENGYQPKGDHLPTPPPIPAHILKALEYIEQHPFTRIQLKK